MQNSDIYLMILGMTLVTYLPRVLPAFLMGRIRLSARVEHFLQLIPYTAMTALVFPGVFSVDALSGCKDYCRDLYFIHCIKDFYI